VYQLINLALIAPLALCLYEAFHRNLFEGALLLGRTFFALVLAMALFQSASDSVKEMFDLPGPYVRAIVFFVLWVLVLWVFEPIAAAILKENGRHMRFKHERPGRVVVGLLSGLFVAGALSANLVMLPSVEGLYFKADAEPIAGLHRLAGGVCAMGRASDALIPRLQMEAGAHWVEGKMADAMRNRDQAEATRLIDAFERRYTKHLPASYVRQARARIERDRAPEE